MRGFLRFGALAALLLVALASFDTSAFVPGDIDDSTVIDAVDVQLVINAVLGLDVGGLVADVNSDDADDAVDVQLVINAALGIDISDQVEMDDILLQESLEPLPLPDDAGSLLAMYDSAGGEARVSVFPGTTIPSGGLTVEPIDPQTVKSALADLEPDFALDLGPDGATFEQPVRVSLLIGTQVLEDDDDEVVPSVEVFTLENDQVVPLTESSLEVTEGGLLIAHTLIDHFSKTIYTVAPGVKVRLDFPKRGSLYFVDEDTIATQLAARNRSGKTVVLKAAEKSTGALSTVDCPCPAVEIENKRQKTFGKGTCECTKPGEGSVEFTVTGAFPELPLEDPDEEIEKPTINKKITSKVKCGALETKITVTTCNVEHVTTYAVTVRHAAPSTNYEWVDITHDDTRAHYSWVSSAVCGKFGTPGNAPDNWYEHPDCPEADEAASRVQVVVTYTADDKREIKRRYSEPARANEGAGPVAF